MRALITGGAGFIGSHLAETLLEQGWSVEIIDDLSTGRNFNLNKLQSTFYCGSVLNRYLITKLIDRADVVFHLAAVVGVQLVLKDPINTIKTNIETTEIVLELCAKKNIPVLLASTSEVYGKSNAPLFREDGDLILGTTSNSRWCYANTKIIDEFLALAYFQLGLPTVIVRLFNTIGPRQSGQYGMVVPRFVQQATTDQPITVYGDGTQFRSFTWVKDVTKALTQLIQTPAAYGEVFNIGHTKQISILDLAYKIKDMTNSKSEIIFVSYENAFKNAGFEDMQRRCPDLTKIKTLIGYEPSFDLNQILTEIIKDTK